LGKKATDIKGQNDESRHLDPAYYDHETRHLAASWLNHCVH